MFAVLYRWQIKPGQEAQFVDGWERVTRTLHEQCGSFGSRLHRAADVSWVGYPLAGRHVATPVHTTSARACA